jgi:SAM-dependent methyltransferase
MPMATMVRAVPCDRGFVGPVPEQEYQAFPDKGRRNRWQERIEVRALAGLLGLPRGRRVLEVECGRGVALPVLAAELAPSRLAGLDVSPGLLLEAASRLRARGTDAELVLGDVRDLPFPAGSFDVVVDFGTCYHVARREAALREVARVLALLRGRHALLWAARAKAVAARAALALALSAGAASAGAQAAPTPAASADGTTHRAAAGWGPDRRRHRDCPKAATRLPPPRPGRRWGAAGHRDRRDGGSGLRGDHPGSTTGGVTLGCGYRYGEWSGTGSRAVVFLGLDRRLSRNFGVVLEGWIGGQALGFPIRR